MPTPKQISRAWNGLKFEYGVRRNKGLNGNQYEVYCCPLDVVDPKVISVHLTFEEAERRAVSLENDARAKAVLKLFQ